MAADSLTVKRSHTYDSRGRPEWSRLVARVVVGAGGRPVGVNRVMWDDRGAVRFEAATGFPVGGEFHYDKADNTLGRFRNIIRDQELTPEDLRTAKMLIEDLEDALDITRKN